MAQLLVFAPCERIIVEHGSSGVSLISLLQEVTVAPPMEGLAADAVAPTVWYVLSMWFREHDEPIEALHQRIAVQSPSGKVLTEIFTDFELTKVSHRNIAVIQGLPVGEPGCYRLRLSLKSKDGEWAEIASYPIELKHATTSS
jgi:hypothetical protein